MAHVLAIRARYTVARADRRHRVRLRSVPPCRRWRRPLGDAGHRRGNLRGPRHRRDRRPFARAPGGRSDLRRPRHRARSGHRRAIRVCRAPPRVFRGQPGRDPRPRRRQPPALGRRDRREPHGRGRRGAPRRMGRTLVPRRDLAVPARGRDGQARGRLGWRRPGPTNRCDVSHRVPGPRAVGLARRRHPVASVASVRGPRLLHRPRAGDGSPRRPGPTPTRWSGVPPRPGVLGDGTRRRCRYLAGSCRGGILPS